MAFAAPKKITDFAEEQVCICVDSNVFIFVFEFERVLSGWEGCKTLSYECIETLRKAHFHAVRPNRSSVILAKT